MSKIYKYRKNLSLTIFQMVFYAVILVIFLRWALKAT